MTSRTLGGPGPGCSVTRLRRLEAGELSVPERDVLEEHVRVCERCQAARRELAEEQRVLGEKLPFDLFAAGVAERVARAGRPERRVARRARAWPIAIAAALVAVAAVPLLTRLARPPGHGSAESDGVRIKGGEATLSVYVQENGQSRLLLPGQRLAPGLPLRVALGPSRRAQAAVFLLDADGAAVLYAGPARNGPLPGAFEWTGAGQATLVAVLADEPIAAPALAEALARSGLAAARRPGLEVIAVQLVRGGGP